AARRLDVVAADPRQRRDHKRPSRVRAPSWPVEWVGLLGRRIDVSWWGCKLFRLHAKLSYKTSGCHTSLEAVPTSLKSGMAPTLVREKVRRDSPHWVSRVVRQSSDGRYHREADPESRAIVVQRAGKDRKFASHPSL